jgi:hypothetical protein
VLVENTVVLGNEYGGLALRLLPNVISSELSGTAAATLPTVEASNATERFT